MMKPSSERERYIHIKESLWHLSCMRWWEKGAVWAKRWWRTWALWYLATSWLLQTWLPKLRDEQVLLSYQIQTRIWHGQPAKFVFFGREATAPWPKQFFHVFPESVWAKGSSNSGGLSNIFTSSHLHTFSSSHLLIFTSSHLYIFTSSHLHIFSSSHLLIFTSSHLHIFPSSHLLIFTSAYLHILTSSHIPIFTSSHLHITSHLSHLHILTSSHLLIFTSSHPHILTSSHPHIFTSSHLHICWSFHLLIFTSLHSLLPSCSLLLFYFSLKARGRANETARNATLLHETMFHSQKLR